VNIQNYTLYRRDRIGRRGGGVAIYVRSALKSSIWTSSADNSTFENMWVRTSVGDVVVAVVYHAPKPLYRTVSFIDHIELCLEELHQIFPTASTVIAGNVNQLYQIRN
jgi:hypothetical protein